MISYVYTIALVVRGGFVSVSPTSYNVSDGGREFPLTTCKVNNNTHFDSALYLYRKLYKGSGAHVITWVRESFLAFS